MPDRSVSVLDHQSAGRDMLALAEELYPICRSITGDGVRATLDILSRLIPIKQHELASGSDIYDWTVPKEWNVTEAWLKGPDGSTVVDFAAHNLHVVSYSTPIRATMSLEDLQPHLHSLPTKPGLIPYVTSYYQETWGFCLSHEQRQSLPEGEYEVYIDSHLEEGHLTWGECVIPGESEDELLLTTHICHPSLANDNCSGMALLAFLGAILGQGRGRYTYRLLFVPGTIGSIAWLAQNESVHSRIKGGLVIAGVGDRGHISYKKSLSGVGLLDRAMIHVLDHLGEEYLLQEYSPYGYDERQFNSPGIGLPLGRLSRTPFGEYPEYHTSGDNLSIIAPQSLAGSLELCLKALTLLETNAVYVNANPKCEPQLGKRGLYSTLGGQENRFEHKMAMLWLLALSDGRHDLLDIAERAGLEFGQIHKAADLLRNAGLLLPADRADHQSTPE